MEDYGNFNVTDRDIEEALNPGSKYHKMSKEEAIYGVWADEGDGETSANKSTKFINFKESKRNKKSTNNVRKGKVISQTENFGSWEKHTTGFGSKMLEKMGFKSGKGLGKDGAGIIEPVQAVPRPGRASIGAYGSEKLEAPRKGIEVDIKQKETKTEKEHEVPEKSNKLWKKTKSNQQKHIYKTFEDLKKETEESTSFLVGSEQIKIVDMTGIEAKVSYGYDSITTQLNTSATPKSIREFEVPEITHNVNLLLNSTEKFIKTQLKKIKIQKDVAISLIHEKEEINKSKISNEEELTKLSSFSEILEQLKSYLENECDLINRIDYFIRFYNIIHIKYYDECKEYNIDGLIGNILIPDLYKLTQTWDIINDPDLYFHIFKKWKETITKTSKNPNYNYISNPNSNSNQIMSFLSSYELFDKTLYEVIGLRLIELLSQYDLRNYHPLLIFLNTWKELMSESMWNYFTNNIILQYLEIQVEKWDPLNDIYPIHIWIKCWIDILGKNLEVIYNIIQRKFIIALSNWHPSDLSPKLMLQPWIDVFKQDQMHMLLIKSIIPKLLDCLNNELIINPRQQVLEPFMWVMEWKDIIPLNVMADLFHRSFFHKWLNVLYIWLQQNPNYEDVKKWYSGWKSLFHPSLQSIMVIKNGFNHALIMIQQSMNGTPLSNIDEYHIKCVQSTPISTTNTDVHKSHKVTLTFKELIEQSATENSLTFTPVPNKRTYDGKSIYQFGISLIYIDKGVIFVQSDSSTSQKWIPISLLQLVKISK